MKNSWPIIGIVAVIILAICGFLFFQTQGSQPQSSSLSNYSTNQNPIVTPEVSQVVIRNENSDNKDMPAMEIDQSKSYVAVLKTTDGDITIALNAKQTPITVNNFVTLAKKNFYDNTIFHRTIKGFMIQGGDPTGTGTGGPGYKFDDEPFTGEYTKGTVAMANAGPNTNGSQFFIMHGDMALPKNYVIFGKVTSGMDVVDKIATAPTEPGGEGSSPVNPVKITSVTIEEK